MATCPLRLSGVLQIIMAMIQEVVATQTLR